MEVDLLGATIILLFSLSSKACMISHPQHLGNIEELWNDVDIPRNFDNDCECGKYAGNGAKPWNLFVHVRASPGGNPTICSATIITSNLLVTSHACFHLPSRYFNIYDVWRPIGGDRNAVWDVADVTVSSSEIIGQGETFPVEEIIYNLNYAVKAAVKTYPPDYDVVLLRVSGDFTATNSQFRPICLPKLDDVKNLVLPGMEAYYYGTVDDRALADIPDFYVGVLKDEGDEECEKMLKGKFSLDKHLCLRFSGGITPPVREGGPLYIDSPNAMTAFLIGIASVVKTYLSSAGVDYNLFTNLMPLIKYMEWQAKKHNSRWCKISASFEARHVEQVRGPMNKTRDPWPWDKFTTPLQRNEVLDCTCGLVNPPAGRIAGGVEAEPYEFGWMALMTFYHNGRSLAGNLCGGTIINDRMILTASHCVVSANKINTKSPAIDIQNVDLRVEVHKRFHDDKSHLREVKTVLYHPDYVPGKRNGIFDYDIALIVLDQPLTFVSGTNSGVRPVCLPKMGAPYEDVVGLQATVVGWGKTNPDDSKTIATSLRKVEVPVAPLDMCSNVAKAVVTERNICAGTLNRFKDAAGGDSGGPLMILRNNRYTEYGIVSWGQDVSVQGVVKTAALYSDVQINFVCGIPRCPSRCELVQNQQSLIPNTRLREPAKCEYYIPIYI